MGIEVRLLLAAFSPNLTSLCLSAYDMDTLLGLGKPLGIELILQKPINAAVCLKRISSVDQ